MKKSSATFMKMKNNTPKIQFVWHCHHDILLEPLIESFGARVKYIKNYKPKEGQKLRLRLFKKVKGKLPPLTAERQRAFAEWQRAFAEWQMAIAGWQRAITKWRMAFAEWCKKYAKEINKLHKKECPNCPWTGKTIFRQSYRIGSVS